MEKVDLAEVIAKEAFILDHEPFESKEVMFDYMADRFIEAGIVTDKDAYICALEERESLGSTYMGNYIGLPHGKSDAVIKPGIGFCRCKTPFTYKSNDEEGEVKYIFMLAIAGSQAGQDYMRVLAKLAGLLTHPEFMDILETGQSYEEVIKMIRKYED